MFKSSEPVLLRPHISYRIYAFIWRLLYGRSEGSKIFDLELTAILN